MAKRHNVFVRLYRGETSFDFIGRRRWWFTISSLVILVCCISFATRGLNPSIDFKGGQSWLVSSQTLTVQQAAATAKAAGVADPTVVQLTNQINHQKQIEVTADLNSKSVAERQAIETNVTDALAQAAGTSPNDVNFNEVGATWGSGVTKKAIEALIIFFIVVSIYISIRFEFKMAVAAIVAVIHDIVVTAGIYSLTGFQVTPDTVVAVLTVLGYSLYDTVVVFDRIRDNSKRPRRLRADHLLGDGEPVHEPDPRPVHQHVVGRHRPRPFRAGRRLLHPGATSLQDFGLALVIGLTSGAYSSIFIASPLLALMKEREPRYITIRQRIESRGDRYGLLTPLAAAAMAGAGSGGGGRSSSARAASGVIRPGAGSARRRPAGTGAPRGSGTEAGPPTTPGGAKSSNGNARTSGGSTRPAGRRPPPRPRKGKGKGKGKRR